MVLMIGISTAGHMDLATSGIFLGRLAKTTSCQESSLITRIWAATIAQSAVPWVPSLEVLAVICWSLMSFQLVVALIHGLPGEMRVVRRLLDYTTAGKTVSSERDV